MPLLHKFDFISDDFPTPQVRGAIPGHSLASPLRELLGSIVAIGISLALFHSQPAFAQAVNVEATHAAVPAGTQPEAAAPASSEAPTSTGPAAAPLPSPAATISGTVLDINGDLVPGATVVLKADSSDDRREIVSDDNAAFKFDSVKPGIPY